ncbi:PEP-CTERM sorting domain-containing protein [Paraglaciecola arctica]|uniref:PEP-CTERM sorting domain-containing protein n=1 Tax=Paraglaciecola arctica TaxID=1128911 RepID=UPI001C071FEB|nr:PEP-CTERM sorting domain-containing protein [Paraglaciecola arctica]MBU3002046.1 PEP-CTERM sorting domain-containing protein [Paraglaciecola arctica]
MKVVNRLVLAVSFMFASMANADVILSLEPSTQTANSGDMVSVSVMIDGLGDGVPLSLGGFDIDVIFDTSVLSFAGYSLSDELGDVGAFEALDLSGGEYFPSVVNILEVSFLSIFDLWDFQSGSFAIAELFFNINPTENHATADIFFAYVDLDDAGGDEIPLFEGNVLNTSISVPSPATLLLMGLGLFAMFVRKKRNQVNV